MTLDELFLRIYLIREDHQLGLAELGIPDDAEPEWFWQVNSQVRFTLHTIEWWLTNEPAFVPK
jgi:hypothetical protein